MRRNARPADEVSRLADDLHSAAIRLLRRVRREDEVVGLSAARLSALSVIVFGGPVRISVLARAEQVRTPTMTPIVAALERDGLITREVDPSDGRAGILRATDKGAKLMAEGRRRRVANLADALRPLGANERATLREAAAILQRTLTAEPRRRDARPVKRVAILVFALSTLFVGRSALRAPGFGIPPVWTEPVTGMTFALVRAGTFKMGTPVTETGREAQEVPHAVTLTSSFYIGRHEVTQAQWTAVMGTNPSFK